MCGMVKLTWSNLTYWSTLNNFALALCNASVCVTLKESKFKEIPAYSPLAISMNSSAAISLVIRFRISLLMIGLLI